MLTAGIKMNSTEFKNKYQEYKKLQKNVQKCNYSRYLKQITFLEVPAVDNNKC